MFFFNLAEKRKLKILFKNQMINTDHYKSMRSSVIDLNSSRSIKDYQRLI